MSVLIPEVRMHVVCPVCGWHADSQGTSSGHAVMFLYYGNHCPQCFTSADLYSMNLFCLEPLEWVPDVTWWKPWTWLQGTWYTGKWKDGAWRRGKPATPKTLMEP
jgi:hypothetical protein